MASRMVPVVIDFFETMMLSKRACSCTSNAASAFIEEVLSLRHCIDLDSLTSSAAERLAAGQLRLDSSLMADLDALAARTPAATAPVASPAAAPVQRGGPSRQRALVMAVTLPPPPGF